MERNIALVCNPTSEGLKAVRIADKLALLISSKGYNHILFTSCWPKDFQEFTEVWIIGGDGTLNYFINQYPELLLPLTIFKGGSGNDFHWMLYGDLSVHHQVDKVLKNKTKYIDAGTCNGKLFANGVGIGFDGAIVSDLLGKKKFGGKTSYLLSILKQIFFYKEQPYEITVEDQKLTKDCFLLSIANGKRYGGGFSVAPRASVTDGLLDLNIIGRINPLKRVRYLPVIEKGKHLDLSFVEYKQTKKVVMIH